MIADTLKWVNVIVYMYRMRLKIMTQHMKCDYSVISGNYYAKSCTLI